MTGVTSEQVAEITGRFLKLYTGAIADILDKNGYRNQVLPPQITPLTVNNRVAGPAFTIQGYPCADVAHDDSEIRLKTLDSALPGSVTVLAAAEARIAPIGARLCRPRSINEDVRVP